MNDCIDQTACTMDWMFYGIIAKVRKIAKVQVDMRERNKNEMKQSENHHCLGGKDDQELAKFG